MTNLLDLESTKVQTAYEAFRASKRQKQEEASDHLQMLKKKIDAESFFTDNNESGYVSKKAFNDYIVPLSDREFLYLGLFFKDITAGRKLSIDRIPKVDRNGKEYYWVKPAYQNIDSGMKIMSFPNFERFYHDYGAKYFTMELSLEALCQVACK